MIAITYIDYDVTNRGQCFQRPMLSAGMTAKRAKAGAFIPQSGRVAMGRVRPIAVRKTKAWLRGEDHW